MRLLMVVRPKTRLDARYPYCTTNEEETYRWGSGPFDVEANMVV
jgi:hypothetical protein